MKTLVVHYLAVAGENRGSNRGLVLYDWLKDIAKGLGCERVYVISTFDVVALYLGAPYSLSEYTPGSESSRGGGLTFCPWSLSEVKLLVDEISEELPLLI